jgi:copper chaperone
MIEFQVKNMTCGHCVSAITKAIKAAEPAAEVEIDLQTKQVRIEGNQDATRYAGLIRDAGYTPEMA